MYTFDIYTFSVAVFVLAIVERFLSYQLQKFFDNLSAFLSASKSWLTPLSILNNSFSWDLWVLTHFLTMWAIPTIATVASLSSSLRLWTYALSTSSEAFESYMH